MAIFQHFPGGGGGGLVDKIAIAFLAWIPTKYATSTNFDARFYQNTKYFYVTWGIFVFAVFKNCWYKKNNDTSYRDLPKGCYMIAADKTGNSSANFYFRKLNSDAEIQSAINCTTISEAQNIGTTVLDYTGSGFMVFANKT